MATDVERLVVSLEASITKYERAMQRALGQTNQTARRIESRYDKMSAGINSRLANVGRGLVGAFAGVAALRGAQQLIDASTRIDNALKVAGLSGAGLEAVYDRLFASAQRNAAPLEALVTLYGRSALVQKELGISSEELLGFTDKVAMALRVSGQSAAESSGALLQLSQALGSGTVRAEEFNSILEGALPIAQAAAAGIEEAGGSVAKLRQLVIEGKVSSEAFFRGFEAGSVMLEEKVAGAQLTVAQGFENLRTEMIDLARDFNEATRTSGRIAGGLEALAEQIQIVGDFFTTYADPINNFWDALERGPAAARAASDAIAGFHDWLRQVRQDIGLAGIIDPLMEGTPDIAPQGPRGRGGRRPPTVAGRTVSLKDFALPGDGSASDKAADKFQKEIDAIVARTDAMRAEAIAQSGLNPLVEDYGYAVERARIEHELLTAAIAAGIPVDEALRSKIAEVADGYASMGVELEKITEAQDMARESMEGWFATGRDMAQGFIDDLVEGRSAAEALGNAFNALGSKLIDLGLNSLFGTGSGSNPFGAIGSMFNIPGRAAGGPVRAGQPYVVGERRPELFVPNQNGMILPRVPGMGGSVSAPVSISIDARGADSAAIARLSGELSQLRAELPSRVVSAVRTAQKHRQL